MNKVVKQIYLKELIKPCNGQDYVTWPHTPNHGDAVSLLESLVDKSVPIPSIWWIDPKFRYRR